MKKLLLIFLFPLVLAASMAPATFQPEGSFSPAAMYSSDAMVFDSATPPDQDSTVDFSLPLNPVSLMPNHHTANELNLSLLTPAFRYMGSAPALDGVLLSLNTKKANPPDDVFFSDYCSAHADCMTILDHQFTFGGGQKSPSSQNDPITPPIVTAGNFPSSGQTFGGGNDPDQIFGTSLNGSENKHRKLVATPEPSSLALLLAGFAALALLIKLRG